LKMFGIFLGVVESLFLLEYHWGICEHY
jgi:hypothetical protein